MLARSRLESNEYTPSEPISRVVLKIPSNINLADPEFHISGSIDVLIGAEILLKLLCVGKLSLASNNVVMQKTHLGWILGEKIPGVKFSNISTCNLSLNLLHNKISEFWEIENGPHDKTLSNEENECGEHYIKNTSRNPKSGRYIVKLPLKKI